MSVPSVCVSTGPQLSGCVTSHVEQASRGRVRAGQRWLRCPSLFLRLSDPMRSPSKTVSAWAVGWVWGWGVRGRSQTHSAALAHIGL